MPPNSTSSLYRAPRLRVLVNGEALSGAYETEINSTNHYSADSFSVSVALGPDRWANAEFWSSETELFVDVQLSLDGAESFTSLIQGFIDTVALDPIAGDVRLSGRDLASALLEAPTQETFANRTASEIATIFATRHGLVPWIVPTTTSVGRFYESDHESLTLNSFSRATTEWDLLVYLAQQENYDVFVIGTGLYFQPVVQAAVGQVLHIQNLIDIRLGRALILARDIQVIVKSWNTQQQTAFVEQASGTMAVASTESCPVPVPTQQHVLIRPNLTPDKAAALAQQHLSELTRHERSIEFSMPGELTLSPRSIISLTGTGTDFDQTYYVESVERTFRPKTGFIQQVRANSSSPRNVTLLASSG